MEKQQGNGLIYGLNDKPHLKEAFFAGLGTGLLCIQGTSFSFIGPIISAGMLGGLPLIFGSCMAASSVEMLISRVLKYTKKIITPLISGIVVTLIGMSLIKVGITACGGI